MDTQDLIKYYEKEFKGMQVVYKEREYIIVGFALVYSEEFEIQYLLRSIESKLELFVSVNDIKVRELVSLKYRELYTSLFELNKSLKDL